MTALRPLRALMILFAGVAAGLVEGVSAATASPAGCLSVSDFGSAPTDRKHSTLLAQRPDEGVRERDDGERHDAARDRPREEHRPVAVVRDHGGHEGSLRGRPENAAE